MARRVGMKISFCSGVTLKRELGSRRTFAVLVPSHCQTVEDVKDFIVEEFCARNLIRLELCIDSVFALRDQDPVDLILFYSNLDTVFEFTRKPSEFSRSPTTSFLQSQVIQSGVIEKLDFSASHSSLSSGYRRKLELQNHQNADDNVDNGGGSPEDSTDRNTPSQKPTDTQHKEEADENKMTRSAKRRDRLRRSVVKRLRANPEDEKGSSDKENPNLEVEAAGGNETQAEGTDATLVPLPITLPQRSKRPVLKRRKFTSTPNPTIRFESLFVNFNPKNEILKEDLRGESSYDPTYYEKLPSVRGIDDVNLQDVIAFQVWEFKGGPIISNYSEARIIGKTEDILSLEYLKGGPSDDPTKIGVQIDGYLEDTSFGLGFQKEMGFKLMLNPKKLVLAPGPAADV